MMAQMQPKLQQLFGSLWNLMHWSRACLKDLCLAFLAFVVAGLGGRGCTGERIACANRGFPGNGLFGSFGTGLSRTGFAAAGATGLDIGFIGVQGAGTAAGLEKGLGEVLLSVLGHSKLKGIKVFKISTFF
jgi:hypothetical protein